MENLWGSFVISIIASCLCVSALVFFVESYCIRPWIRKRIARIPSTLHFVHGEEKICSADAQA